MSFRVRVTPRAAADMERLFDHLVERELQRADGDLDIPELALGAIHGALRVPETTPFTCRKAGDSPFLRELVIPFGHTGYVALFEIVGEHEVWVAAVRHQREDDYR